MCTFTPLKLALIATKPARPLRGIRHKKRYKK
jgi:hypothetical protein